MVSWIVYLHDISIRTITAADISSLEMLRYLCGDAAIRKVVFVTTNWEPTHEKERREEELKGRHWKAMIKKGAGVHRFERNKQSALDIINSLLKGIESDGEYDSTYFQIQKELVDERISIRETNAGKFLSKAGKFPNKAGRTKRRKQLKFLSCILQ